LYHHQLPLQNLL
jgi:hypothetical protein